MKKILLIGGTGAMGVYLLPELLKQGYQVDITTRRHINSHDIDDNNTKYITGNAHDISFLQEVLNNNYDTIIDFMVYSTEEFANRVNLLLENTSQYIFLSTYRVFANEDKIINENSPRLLDVSKDTEYLKTDEYALTKARQEDIIKNTQYNNWTIVRPSITYSKARFQLEVLEADTVIYRSLKNKKVVLPRELSQKYTTMTWAGDVAKMIAGLVLNN
ncbi:MAG: NAD-dependent epimerase/dehydratase family protein, partial [Bifidobacteriaceae bacterium]|nr:NAD-dependent epimerase/dehydratase family protein [Bifidobacteriaceae bacterium]